MRRIKVEHYTHPCLPRVVVHVEHRYRTYCGYGDTVEQAETQAYHRAQKEDTTA